MEEQPRPASDRQYNYVDYLIRELGWDGMRLNTFAKDRRIDLLRMTTKEAATLIDGLLAERDGRNSVAAPVRAEGEE
jgi:DNA-nicking Smr family endonuclease